MWRVKGHFTGLRKLDLLSGISKVKCNYLASNAGMVTP